MAKHKKNKCRSCPAIKAVLIMARLNYDQHHLLAKSDKGDIESAEDMPAMKDIPIPGTGMKQGELPNDVFRQYQ